MMLIGRLTRDPEVRTIPSGQSVASFSVATGRSWTDQQGQKQEKTEFHNVVVWRKLADIVGQYLRKGRQVYVEGRLETRSWEDQTGTKKYRTEIVGENVIMLGPRPEGISVPTSTSTGFSAAPSAQEVKKAADASAPAPAAGAEEEIRVEDIPF